jgi:aminodeoxyfutalosine synthase
LKLKDPELTAIAEKVAGDIRLERDDALVIATSSDLVGVGMLANHRRELLHGDRTYFNVNRHLNPSNVCVAGCNLCAFSVPSEEHERGWRLTVDEALRAAERDVDPTVSELHVVGALDPELGLSYYETLLTRLKERFPWVHLKALTMVELDFIATRARLSIEETLIRLRAAGLDSCPGGGAEIFAPRVRSLICPSKISAERWLEVGRIVHRSGLRSNSTMLYGHVETAEERVDHLLALRELQDETGGFQCMVPLAFHPANTRLDDLPTPGGRLDLQTIALSRLVLDNVRHIKAYWVMLGPKVAQVALRFGADDLDGTVIDERVAAAAGADGGQGMKRSRLEALIRGAGRTPVLRDSLYRAVGHEPVMRDTSLSTKS